jgi:hypothetical protein
MASKKEIEEHLKIALDEVGKIKPWFDKDVNAWVFSHHSYPVEYAGDSREDVIKGYPLYLREFIRQRLNHNLARKYRETNERAWRKKSRFRQTQRVEERT